MMVDCAPRWFRLADSRIRSSRPVTLRVIPAATRRLLHAVHHPTNSLPSEFEGCRRRCHRLLLPLLRKDSGLSAGHGCCIALDVNVTIVAGQGQPNSVELIENRLGGF